MDIDQSPKSPSMFTGFDATSLWIIDEEAQPAHAKDAAIKTNEKKFFRVVGDRAAHLFPETIVDIIVTQSFS